jgi:hypothetical protein
MNSFAKHIFLSYAHKDFWEARAIYNELRLAGLSVWIDDHLTPGTPNWQEAINTALDEATCQICICSPNARKSKWVNIEIELANNKNIKIYPILVKGNPKDSIPLALTIVQFSDMRGNQILPLDRLISGIIENHAAALRVDVRAIFDAREIQWTHFGSLFWFASEVRKLRLFFSSENPTTLRIRESVAQLIHHAKRLNVDKFTLRDLQDVANRLENTNIPDLDKGGREHIANKLRLAQDKVAGLAEKADLTFQDGPFPGKPNP